MDNSTERPVKWQPVLLVVTKRIECQCGALATVISGRGPERDEPYYLLDEVDAWCQDCFFKAQK